MLGVFAAGFGWCTWGGGGVADGCCEVVGCCAIKAAVEWLVAEKKRPLLPRHSTRIRLNRFMIKPLSYL